MHINSVCRLCGSSELSFLFVSNEVNLLRCRHCSYVQISRKPTPVEIAAIYGEHYFTSSKYNEKNILYMENIRRIRLMRLFVPTPEATVLDAGCATGDFLSFAKMKYQVYGFDLSEFAVSEARRTNPDIADRISVRNIEASRFNVSQFDAICLWDVIEHLWNPVKVCQNLACLLKPGGYFFISTPDIGSFMARILGRRWAFMTPPEHMGFFSVNSFSYLFGRALPFHIGYSKSFGKWTNLGFMVYKLRRIFPSLIPESLVKLLQHERAGKLQLYVPTKDIRYLAVRKI